MRSNGFSRTRESRSLSSNTPQSTLVASPARLRGHGRSARSCPGSYAQAASASAPGHRCLSPLWLGDRGLQHEAVLQAVSRLLAFGAREARGSGWRGASSRSFGDPELTAYIGHGFSVEKPANKAQTLIHYRTLLPRHRHLFPLNGGKSVTHVSGTLCHLSLGSHTASVRALQAVVLCVVAV